MFIILFTIFAMFTFGYYYLQPADPKVLVSDPNFVSGRSRL